MADRPFTARDSKDEFAVVRTLDKLSEESKTIADRASILENTIYTNNPKQSAIAAIGYSENTISATYVQAEIEQLTTDIKTVADKLDAVIAALIAADILA